ncbi:hypothetical protein ACFSW8_12590 [Rubritalea tangerina]|uniref:Uncharacterized protein n=1 Tax=Rubritalea tangerina TaxID=430798 RepID=A0ABW4ZCK0_9BACT
MQVVSEEIIAFIESKAKAEFIEGVDADRVIRGVGDIPFVKELSPPAVE